MVGFSVHGKDLEGAKAVRRQSKKMAYVKENNVKKVGCGYFIFSWYA